MDDITPTGAQPYASQSVTQAAKSRYVTLLKHDQPIVGSIRVPGSKSLTNRALILAALANGRSVLRHVLLSDDTNVMIEALKQMGVTVSFSDPTTIEVTATGQLNAPTETVFLGNAGTATRFLTAISCLVTGRVTIDGDEYMRQRPIMPLVEALKRLGVSVTCETGCPPLTIEGTGGFDGSEVSIDANLSSQYVSALLMLAPFGREGLNVLMQDDHIGGRGYIDLTLDLMKKFGVEATEITGTAGWSIAPQRYIATDYDVEPDASSATYIWAMEALTGGQIDIGCDPQTMSQPDARVYELIRSFPEFPEVINGSQFQDAVPTLAVMAAFCGKSIRFTGIENLRVKECDRIRALSEGLCAIHTELAEEQGDDLIVNGQLDLKGLGHIEALIDSKDDHRIAMCFSLAGLMIEGVSIRNPSCVAKTYPSYWDTLQQLGVKLAFSS